MSSASLYKCWSNPIVGCQANETWCAWDETDCSQITTWHSKNVCSHFKHLLQPDL